MNDGTSNPDIQHANPVVASSAATLSIQDSTEKLYHLPTSESDSQEELSGQNPAKEKEMLGEFPVEISSKSEPSTGNENVKRPSSSLEKMKIKIPPETERPELSTFLRKGKVVKIVTDSEDDNSIVKEDNGDLFKFEIESVKNVGKEDVFITEGSIVRFSTSVIDPNFAESVFIGDFRIEEERRSDSHAGQEKADGCIKKQGTYHGKVSRFFEQHGNGFIKPNQMPQDVDKKDVYFHYSQIRNPPSSEYQLNPGTEVSFNLRTKSNNERNLRASEVYLDIHTSNNLKKGASMSDLREIMWRVAKVEDVSHSKITLRCLKDRWKVYYLLRSKLSAFALPLREGDLVQFILRNKNDRNVWKAKVDQYKADRSLSDYVKFFNSISAERGNTTKAFFELNDMTPLWTHLGNVRLDEEDMRKYVEHLLIILTKLMSENKQHKALLSKVMGAILNSKFLSAVAKIFQEGRHDMDFHIEEDIVLNFSKACITSVPHMCSQLRTLTNLFSTFSKEALVRLVQTFFSSIGSLCQDKESSHWRDMPIAPTKFELTESLLVEDSLLRKIELSPYDDPDEYMDTFYRLMRAEAFSAIQTGIKDYLKGELNERDMYSYFKIMLVGTEVTKSGISLALKFLMTKPVKNWEVSPRLMYGNLLCISPSGQFDDPIWATVTNRDPDLLRNSSIICVEPIAINEKSNAEIISELQKFAKNIVMVESPTYFQTLNPIMKALRLMDLNEFSLMPQIVKSIPSTESFDYSIDPTENLSDPEEMSPLSDSYEQRKIAVETKVKHISEGLDDAQRVAFEHALDHRLAIIQGPPGCGKTFLGLQLLNVLLEWRMKKPILLLTYKNHALDEFLKGAMTLDNCSLVNIVRIGGRSKEPKLEERNLKNIQRDFRQTSGNWDKIMELKNDIEILRQEFNDLFDKFYEHSRLKNSDILNLLSDEQLESLLTKYQWHINKTYKIKKKPITRKLILEEILPYIKCHYESLTNFLEECRLYGTPNEFHAKHCFNLLSKTLSEWVPDKSITKQLASLQIEQFHDQLALEDVQDENENDYDEDYIKELLSQRQSLMGILAKSSTVKKSNVNLLKMQNYEKGFHYCDFPKEMHPSDALILVSDMWKLTETQRLQMIFSFLHNKRQEYFNELNSKIDELEIALQEKQALELEAKVEGLSKMKIIGMTITGASIHNELLNRIKPSVVIVEEAAEILEPSLLAALNDRVEHLILIGDHKQLPPQVDTYKLIKNFSFDMSMMERLIKTGFPFKSLRKQNRMRIEFAELLKDIYPDLESNVPRVSKNVAPKCLKTSMFFWNHNFLEDGVDKKDENEKTSRSKVNKNEAELVLSLVTFLLLNGYQPSQITVLAAYLGQQKVLRMKLQEWKKQHPTLFESENSDNRVNIQTVDSYQGDENDIVIVSLVRSNPDGHIGFLDNINRRCVAQSRAKCCMIFVGNGSTMSTKIIRNEIKFSVWNEILSSMKNEGCFGDEIVLQCQKHQEASQVPVSSVSQIREILKNPKTICNKSCGELFPCCIVSHACQKNCIPLHDHSICRTLVNGIHPNCGHTERHKCYEDINSIKCKQEVDFRFKKCGHQAVKKCYQDEKDLACKKPCSEKMSCGVHDCNDVCGNSHSHILCRNKVKIRLSRCDHEVQKKCSEDESNIKCREFVSKTLPCGHEASAECWKKSNEVKCTSLCEKMMVCGLHKCKRLCGESHSHSDCEEKVHYTFPQCGHPSPMPKKCSEKITWVCKQEVQVIMPECKHPGKKLCFEKVNDLICPVRPCGRIRDCGHPCENKCGENCNLGKCKECETLFKKKMNKVHEDAKRKVEKLQEQLKSDESRVECSWKELFDYGETKAEYLRVADMVEKFALPHVHNFQPTVEKIWKITNLKLELQFEKARSQAFGDHIDFKFHGTSTEGIDGITKNGFRMPNPQPRFGTKPGMYGQGIYFATNSTKSAQEIYTKGSKKLLLCKVLLGRSKEVRKADPTITKRKLRDEGYDSVFAPRESKGDGGVMNDEFIIFDKNQAYPEYVIKYRVSNNLPTVPQISKALKSPDKKYQKIRLDPSRNFDPTNPKDVHFKIAESHLLSMKARSLVSKKHEIDYIEYIINKPLEDAFQKQKNDFRAKKIPSGEVLAFHGTKVSNIDSILEKNLDPKHSVINGRVHGNGCYFSEFPDFSLGYGSGLIMFRVLPGKEYNGPKNDIPHGYNSKNVNPDANKYCQMLIINNAKQFVPYFVYHFK